MKLWFGFGSPIFRFIGIFFKWSFTGFKNGLNGFRDIKNSNKEFQETLIGFLFSLALTLYFALR